MHFHNPDILFLFIVSEYNPSNQRQHGNTNNHPWNQIGKSFWLEHVIVPFQINDCNNSRDHPQHIISDECRKFPVLEPVLASLIKFSHPQPFLDAQKITKITDPSGRILLEIIKSSRSIMFVPSPRIWIPDHGPNPRIAGMERTMIRTIFTRTALFRFQPHKSIAKERIFSNTAITVDNAANDINKKNSVPQSLPPAI